MEEKKNSEEILERYKESSKDPSNTLNPDISPNSSPMARRKHNISVQLSNLDDMDLTSQIKYFTTFNSLD
jgi:hypothetical protein